MAGPAGTFETMRPLQLAVIPETPKNIAPPEAPDTEPLLMPFTPETGEYVPCWTEYEGRLYDVNHEDDAKKYLTKILGKEIVEPRGWIDRVTGGHYSHEMVFVERAAIYEDGRVQNDAEHSYISADISSTMLETLGIDDVDSGKASKMCVRHDRREALSGDTSIFDVEALKTKFFRETAAITIQKAEAMHTPDLAEQDEEYDAAKTPTARWAHGVDGIEPGYQALKNRAALQRSRPDNLAEMSEKQFEKTVIHGAAFAVSFGIQIELAKKWDDWDCQPCGEDPVKLVTGIAERVFKQKAGPTQEREYAKARAKLKELYEGAYDFHLPDLTLHDETVKARELGAIVMSDWLAEKNRRSTPPTPPQPSPLLATA